MPVRKPLSVADTIWIALVMLLGTEGVDYYFYGDGRGDEEWRALAWLHKN